jgi:hypothetical protein
MIKHLAAKMPAPIETPRIQSQLNNYVMALQEQHLNALAYLNWMPHNCLADPAFDLVAAPCVERLFSACGLLTQRRGNFG